MRNHIHSGVTALGRVKTTVVYEILALFQGLYCGVRRLAFCKFCQLVNDHIHSSILEGTCKELPLIGC